MEKAGPTGFEPATPSSASWSLIRTRVRAQLSQSDGAPKSGSYLEAFAERAARRKPPIGPWQRGKSSWRSHESRRLRGAVRSDVDGRRVSAGLLQEERLPAQALHELQDALLVAGPRAHAVR